jgi:GNAT superfamily N-acetyltransferase
VTEAEYAFAERLPSPEAYNALREIAGWGALEANAVRESLPRSAYGVVAEHRGETIGFARMVGDGGLCFYIQEIIVHPDHRRRGIAGTFMKYIFRYIAAHAVPSAYVAVFAGKGLEGFYAKHGFWQRPTTEMGPGMMQFWRDGALNRRFGRTEQT